MQVEIWSDIVCPWCYLGERRFGRAIDQLPWREQVSVRWRSFQLDPRAPEEPQDLGKVLERKYGPGALASISSRLGALGPAEGIEYRWDLIQRINTFDAHRLLAWAGDAAPDRQAELLGRLFRAYFTEGENLADRSVLARIATEVSLDGDQAMDVLSSGAFAEAVRRDQAEAHERGIGGVPAFLLEGRLMIPGAQEVETFVALLERARERFGGEAEEAAEGAPAGITE